MHTDQIDQDIVVTWHKRTVLTRPPSIIFEQGVQTVYGFTTLISDRLVLDLEPGHKHGLAEGHVRVLDPDGTLTADRLFFDWVNKTGSGQNIDAHAHRLMFHANNILAGPKVWTLEGLYATPCGGESHPLLAVQAPKAIVAPKGDATIVHPTLLFRGRKIITLRNYVISSNSRSNGQPLPSLSYSRSGGIAGGWAPSYNLDDLTALNGGIHLGQHQRPSEDLLLSRSLLPASAAPGGFLPRSDFEERFNFSYFDNVFIRTPDQERNYVSATRSSLSVGTAWNEYPVARLTSTAFSKPVDIIYEQATSFGGFGEYAQLRGQRIQQLGGTRETRAVASGALLLPELSLGKGSYTDIRLDGSAYLGDKNHYGWGHLQAGLVTRPSKYVRLAAAYEGAFEQGTPTFVADRLYKNHWISVRSDLFLGPTKLSVLQKYDPRGQSWFDSEFQISQVAGCLEPYLVYRRFPRGYSFGFRLRVDDLLDVIRRRQGLKTTNPDER